jgi:hypothetical protein
MAGWQGVGKRLVYEASVGLAHGAASQNARLRTYRLMSESAWGSALMPLWDDRKN